MSRLRKWLWVAVAVIAGAICLLVVRKEYFADPLNQAYFYEPWQTGSREYHAARSRWQARPFAGYHLIFQSQRTHLEARPGEIPDYVTDTCGVDVIVADRAEQQVRLVSNSCPPAVAHSVAQIFAMFEERADRPVGKPPRYDPETGCYSTDVGYLDLIEADYAEVFGYPRHIGNRPSLWDLSGYCWSWLTTPHDMMQAERDQVMVTDLTPLQ